MTTEDRLASPIRDELTATWGVDGDTVIRVAPRGALPILDLAEEVTGDADQAWELVGEVGSRLLDFEWQSLGPMVWDSHLDRWAAPGGTTFLLVPDAVDGHEHVIASVEGREVDGAIRRIFAELMRTNGEAFGTDWFGGLPSRFTNLSGGVIPRELVRESVLGWVDGPGDGDWLSLRQDLIDQIDEPDPLRRSLSLLDSLVDEGPASWLERRELLRERGRALPQDHKEMIVDAYLARSYLER